MKPTTLLRLVSAVSMLRMTGGIPALPLYAFMACTGTTLPLPLAQEIYCKFSVTFQHNQASHTVCEKIHPHRTSSHSQTYPVSNMPLI